jgi:hypothetical protein
MSFVRSSKNSFAWTIAPERVGTHVCAWSRRAGAPFYEHEFNR